MAKSQLNSLQNTPRKVRKRSTDDNNLHNIYSSIFDGDAMQRTQRSKTPQNEKTMQKSERSLTGALQVKREED
jgi:hypothetical protein